MPSRFDIQVLRGVAVLLVVVFHGFANTMPGGYVGVDVFFVISESLITSIVIKDLETGSFTFREFYVRRAKRLLPASYATFIIITIAAYAILTISQWRLYLAQIFGRLTFSANIILSRMTD